MSVTVSDRIEREIVLRAPLDRVWQALTDARQFGQWFGVELSGAFAPGGRVTAKVTGDKFTGLSFDIFVQHMEPERLFSWRWYPHAVESGIDYSREPTTLVEFHLEAADGGTRLRVVESGFDQVSPSRRLDAYRGNEEGWTIQMANIERYVAAR
jgi:uncharacterized protein YndB with AHSA1/START domain